MKLLNEQSSRTTQDANIQLFPHQQAILARLIELETTPSNEPLVGILSDPPGSGKSFPLLALMLMEKKRFGKTQNLLVIPHSLHEQWLTYIKQFSPELTVQSLMYYGDITALAFDARVLFAFDILITTASYYSHIADTVRDIKTYFSRVVIDEIDSISLFTNVNIPATSIWLISATAELTKDGAYKKYIKEDNKIECEPNFIQKSIKIPDALLKHHNCYDKYLNILVKAVDNKIEYNAFSFNGIHLKYESSTIHSSKDALRGIYRDSCLEMKTISESVASQSRKRVHPSLEAKINKGIAAFKTTVGKEQVEFDPIRGVEDQNKEYNKLKQRVEKISSLMNHQMCPLCVDDFKDGEENKVQKTCCQPIVYHKLCMDKWILTNNTCPECTRPVSTIVDTSGIITEKPNYANKIEQLLTIVNEQQNVRDWKMLIFSDFVDTFNKVKIEFDKHNVQFAVLEGNQITISKALDSFKNGNKNVLLIHSQHYGGGLNLEFVNSIVLLHKTIRNDQLIGRAQRFGRTSRLTIHHLLYTWEK